MKINTDPAMIDKVAELRAEIKRLAAHNNRLISRGHDLAEMVTEQEAEIERLRAALQLSQSQNYCTLCGCDLDRALAGEQEKME